MTDFLFFWRDLFIRPRAFFGKHFGQGLTDARYFYFTMVIFGLGAGIDRIDRQLTEADIKGNLDSMNFVNTWPGYWIVGLVAGTIGGFISYHVGGWFYNVRIKWCKGDDNIELARYLFLYSGVVKAAVIVLIAFVTMFFQSQPYVADAAFGVRDAVVMLVSVFSIYYSVYVSFAGVTTVTNVNWTRAVIWFMVLPSVFFTLMYVALIAILYNYFSGRLG